MYNVKDLLVNTDFPCIRRDRLTTVQMNLGYLCNLSCTHCHVNAGPKRTELMAKTVMETVLQFAKQQQITTLDVTGGSPEMNPNFRWLVRAAKNLGLHVIDRCNPTILMEPDYEWAADFLAENQVEIIASLPCYLEENVDAQRGNGVFNASIDGLKALNMRGYGKENGDLILNLVFNPQGPTLPPPQEQLEADYRQYLKEHFAIQFNHLFALANMPIQRFGAVLIAKSKQQANKTTNFSNYLALLKQAHQPQNLANVMCRNLISIDWQGYVYDCDFNQMLAMPLEKGDPVLIEDLMTEPFDQKFINVAEHCYGCTAGQGSSCSGALQENKREAANSNRLNNN